MSQWRWDQGRLAYFSYEAVQSLAVVLVTLDGVDTSEDLGRFSPVMRAESGFDFLPLDYGVWRNYARVFKLAMLATEIEGVIYSSTIAKRIADPDDGLTSDEYYSLLAKVHSTPSAIFQNEEVDEPVRYPLLSVVKLILAKSTAAGVIDGLTIEEITSTIEAAGLSGTESFSTFRDVAISGDRVVEGSLGRQAREMIKVISNLSFLEWRGKCLCLTDSYDENVIAYFFDDQDINDGEDAVVVDSVMLGSDIGFVEGQRKLRSHYKMERNRSLIGFYFRNSPNPEICDLCGVDACSMYPWEANLIEVHHKLPLASASRLGVHETTIGDLAGLCPCCHKAVHRFYRQWLSSHSADDFSSVQEAHEVYLVAKELYLDSKKR